MNINTIATARHSARARRLVWLKAMGQMIRAFFGAYAVTSA